MARPASCRRCRTSRPRPAARWSRSARRRSPTTGPSAGATSTGRSRWPAACACGRRGTSRRPGSRRSSSTRGRRSAPARTTRRGCASSCCASSIRAGRSRTSAAARACSRSPPRSLASGRCSASTTSAESVAATQDNARANGVEVRAERFDLLRDGPAPSAPTVAANLLRPLLLAVARDGFAGAPPQVLVASGLLRHEADEVAAAFAGPRPARGRPARDDRVGRAAAAGGLTSQVWPGMW